MAASPFLNVLVQMDRASFRDFAVFDVLQRQKRWKRPLLFMVILLVFAAVCFTQVGNRQGAALLGTTLMVVGIGLPLVYFGMFFNSVGQQAKKMGLTQPKAAYRVELDEQGLTVHSPGEQDKQASQLCPWDKLYAAYCTPNAVYLYVAPGKAYLLPAAQIPQGTDALWQNLAKVLPAEKLHKAK